MYPYGFSAGSLAGNSKLAVGVDAGPFVSPGGPKINWWQVQGLTSPSPHQTAGIRFCNLVTPSAGEAVVEKGRLFELELVIVDERLTIHGESVPTMKSSRAYKNYTVIARWYSQDDGHHCALLTRVIEAKWEYVQVWEDFKKEKTYWVRKFPDS